jgi:acyl-CoA synthetase (NDP forming)
MNAIKLFFEPKTVALIGASANEWKPGCSLFNNMKVTFGDNFFPVHPSLSDIAGKKCYKSILDAPAPIDTAVIFIPARAVPEALEQCAQKGVKAVIIESAGFEEVGTEGIELNRRCLEIAHKNGMRLWGPNCMGMLNVRQMKILSFMNTKMWQGRLIPGDVALIVQSGMLSAGFLLHIITKTPFGLSKVCSIGNKMDVDESDLLEYFIEDPETAVIGMYLESVKRGRKFFELAKSTDKPIVVLKSGRTSFGAQAAASHTASMAQDDAVLNDAFKQARIIRVYEMEDMMELSRCLSKAPHKRIDKPQIAVLTFSGGAGVVCSDDAYDHGMEMAKLRPETLKRIKAVFPEWMDPSNPVDLYPAMEKNGPIKTFGESLEAVMLDPGVDAVFLHIFAVPIKMGMFNYDIMAEMVKKHRKPVVAWLIGQSQAAADMAKELEQRGIAVVDEIGKGVRVIAALTMRK